MTMRPPLLLRIAAAGCMIVVPCAHAAPPPVASGSPPPRVDLPPGACDLGAFRPASQRQRRLVKIPSPEAPAPAARAGQDGCVIVSVHVAADGSVHDASLLREMPPGFGFGDAVVAAIAKERFAPDAPPDDLQTQKFSFHLSGMVPAKP